MDGSSTLADAEPTNQDEMTAETDGPNEESGATDTVGDAEVIDAPSIEPTRVVEAILMAAESPMTAAKIASVLGVGTGRDIRKNIETLNAEYDDRGASFRVEEIAGGFQILTLPEYNTWLKKLLRVRQETKLTPAAMETLAIIAYKQPCTRAEVESVRGVAAGDGVNRLREMNLVKIVGRAEDLGRPLLYGTTKKFLEVFGLPSLEDLPQVAALRPPEPKTKPDKPAQTKSDIDPAAPPAETSDGHADSSPSDSLAEEPDLHIVHDEDEAENKSS